MEANVVTRGRYKARDGGKLRLYTPGSERQAQIPLLAFSSLFLLQVGKGCQGQRQLIRTQCLQEALFHLCIQSDGSHFLTRLASKLALVVVADIDRKLSVRTGVAQMQECATIATAHDPLE